LDSALSHGSGSSDMFAYIPTSAFAGSQGQYLYLYSGFGENNKSDGGFEEWGMGEQTSTGGGGGSPMPEPASLMLLSSGLIGISGIVRRMKR
jgi:hypothetical protein